MKKNFAKISDYLKINAPVIFLNRFEFSFILVNAIFLGYIFVQVKTHQLISLITDNILLFVQRILAYCSMILSI